MITADDEFRSLVAAALDQHRGGRLEEAEKAYRAALARIPDHPAVLHNLGTLEAEQGRTNAAIALFDRAIAREPTYTLALCNRAAALRLVGRARDAIRDYLRASTIEPDNYAAHRALAFLFLAEGECGRALDHFARTYELRRGDDRIGLAGWSLTHATRAKLRHDADQFAYLARNRRDPLRFQALARQYGDVAREFPETVAALSADDRERIGTDYNTAIHVRDEPELAGRAIADRPDRGAVADHLFADRPGVATIEGLLTPAAFDGLRRFLLESTIWHDFTHIGGFVAAYLEDGLASPLLLQIVDELRQALPDILGPYPLTQAWAFKALAPNTAVAAHADDGAVSVNFWLTPDAANRSPDGGGLCICRAAPPADWPLASYVEDHERCVAFLGHHAAETVRIGYRANRAVLFESRLVHASDAPSFARGYENHRINMTLLFGMAPLGPVGRQAVGPVQGSQGGPEAPYQI